MKYSLIPVVALATLSLIACNQKAGKDREKLDSNPVKDYINVPKEKARDVRDAVEKKQDEEKDQAEELLDDE